jgi:ADP-heptose:LPS heptosyltransferase
MRKILIIRFSSFGDIFHALSVVGPLSKKYPDCQIDWLTKIPFESILEGRAQIRKVITLEKKNSFLSLIKLAFKLRKEEYDLVYDAHNNLRSSILSMIIRPFSAGKYIIRSKDRFKRLLLFTFGVNKFPRPFRAFKSFSRPLLDNKIIDEDIFNLDWSDDELSRSLTNQIKGRIILCPSAAWEMKRWPLPHWKKLIDLLPEYRFAIVAGPDDLFCEELVLEDSERVINLAGQVSLKESCSIIAQAPLIVSADTGTIHVSDLFNVKGISLMGPSAFGFSSFPNTHTLEVELDCRPCSKDGRGKCSQDVWQKCMVDISPSNVATKVRELL